MKKIRIACDTKDTLQLEQLIPFQGKLKKLTKTNYEKLKNEILTTGFAFPIYVWKGLRGVKYIIGGHQRVVCLQNMQSEGYSIPDLPVVFIEASNMAEAKRRVLQDVSQYGDVDKKGLHEFMIESEISMDLLSASFQIPDGELDMKSFRSEFFSEEEAKKSKGEDEIPTVKKKSKTKFGDIYILGKNRVMCGDSTNESMVMKLMDGNKSDITFTSPPYNVGKTPNGNEQKYLNNSDDKTQVDFCAFLKTFTEIALRVSTFVFVNIQSLSGNKTALIEYLYEMRGKFADTIIWDKLTAEPAMAKNVLNSRFEYVHVFSERANRVIGMKEFRGTLENMVFLNSRKDKEFSEIHKATFPVAFAEHFIENFSNVSVYEPFGGVGTTLIAAQKIGRTAYLMELDPHYVDVIVTRWEKFTGEKAVHVRSDVKLKTV